MRIQTLGLGGAAQLAADSEYFCNVMSALAVAPPAVLITVQVGRRAVGVVRFAGGGGAARVMLQGCWLGWLYWL